MSIIMTMMKSAAADTTMNTSIIITIMMRNAAAVVDMITTMTIITYGDDATAKQIIRQANKVQEVVASDLNAGEA